MSLASLNGTTHNTIADPLRISQQSATSSGSSTAAGAGMADSRLPEAPQNGQIYLNPYDIQNLFDDPKLLTWASHPQPSQSVGTLRDVKPSEARFPCLVDGCESDFGRVTDLKRHVKSTHEGPRMDCPHKWCGRVGDHGSIRKDHFNEHLRDVHKDNRFRSSSRTETVKPSETRFPCLSEGCGSEFGRVTDLKRHYNSVHVTSRIDCPHNWCGRTGAHGFSRKDHFNEHLREVHKQDIPKASNRRSSKEKRVRDGFRKSTEGS